MTKRIDGLLLTLLLVPAIFSTQTSQAFDIKAASVVMVAFIKNCFSPACLKAATYTSARALWHAAKVTAIATVLCNIVMPTQMRRVLSKKPLIGRFIFKRERVWQDEGNSPSPLHAKMS